jgi:nitrous oxide reductase accessory protein NosL
MDRQAYDFSRMLLEFDDKMSEGTCSIHCTAAEMAAHREKTIIRMLVGDYATKELIDVQKAFWVLGGKQAGVMTGRAKWAFREKTAAEAFIKEHGGTLGTYNDAMKAAFVDMRDDIKMLREKKRAEQTGLTDIKEHPGCRYCGMDRNVYDYSRMLLEYTDGASAGTCSIHCAAIDLALNPERAPKAIMVGDYRTKQLIDALRACWVIGGSRRGVMSIQGKWAFEEKGHAEDFMKDHGGKLGSFDDALQAAFEDMYEILR